MKSDENTFETFDFQSWIIENLIAIFSVLTFVLFVSFVFSLNLDFSGGFLVNLFQLLAVFVLATIPLALIVSLIISFLLLVAPVLKALFKSILNPLIILFLLLGFVTFLLYIFEETGMLTAWLLYLSIAAVYNWYHWDNGTNTAENPKQTEKVKSEIEAIHRLGKYSREKEMDELIRKSNELIRESDELIRESEELLKEAQRRR